MIRLSYWHRFHSFSSNNWGPTWLVLKVLVNKTALWIFRPCDMVPKDIDNKAKNQYELWRNQNQDNVQCQFCLMCSFFVEIQIVKNIFPFIFTQQDILILGGIRTLKPFFSILPFIKREVAAYESKRILLLMLVPDHFKSKWTNLILDVRCLWVTNLLLKFICVCSENKRE